MPTLFYTDHAAIINFVFLVSSFVYRIKFATPRILIIHQMIIIVLIFERNS